MSSDKDLQEMEVKTQQSKTAVNAGASAADPMDTSVAGPHTRILVVLLQKILNLTTIQTS